MIQMLVIKKKKLLDLFIISNFFFLALDIVYAHSINNFAHWGEWIPLYLCLVATVFFRGRFFLSKKNKIRPINWNRSNIHFCWVMGSVFSSGKSILSKLQLKISHLYCAIRCALEFYSSWFFTFSQSFGRVFRQDMGEMDHFFSVSWILGELCTVSLRS